MTLLIVIAVCGAIAVVLGGVMCSSFSINAWREGLLDLVMGMFLVLVGLALLVGDVLLFLFVHNLLDRI